MSAESSGRGRRTQRSGGRKKTAGARAPRPAKVAQRRNGRAAHWNVADLLKSRRKADLVEPYRFWAGDDAAHPPARVQALRTELEEWMLEPERLSARVESLGRKHRDVFDALLASPRYEATVGTLASSRELGYLSQFDLEGALAALADNGLVCTTDAVEGDARAYAVPADLGDVVVLARRARTRGVFDLFTLKGHLERLYGDPTRERPVPPNRLREMYKMYANEPAAVARVERLPEGLRDLVGKVVLEFGGLLPRSLFERMETELPHWNGRRWRKILEESLIGTVERLELTRFGIGHADETLIVFNEVTLAWTKRKALPSDPDAPHDEASLGVDLPANISRFLAFIIDHSVRFTVRGEIFKTTEKRILSDLIPNPGRELERAEVLQFIYRFARHAGLIESTGERTFALTRDGREWEPQTLEEKLRALFDHVLDEHDDTIDPLHQLRLRRVFLRLVKRIEPGVWYDIMYLPFLARNAYLAQLGEIGVEEDVAATRPGGGGPEDLQRLAWNLVGWVRKRLYLLGLVDLGYDEHGHPVAMRLTRIGARLLGMVEPVVGQAGVGSLVVTPDFEVVLFPSGDDADLTHDLDRFCDREKEGHLRHFRITDRSVHRGLVEGMSLERMVGVLEQNARTPVPQNVVYSIRGWAHQAGLLVLDDSLVVRGQDEDAVRRFVRDPGVRPYVRKTLDDRAVQLKTGTSPARYRALFRDLDYLVEIAS